VKTRGDCPNQTVTQLTWLSVVQNALSRFLRPPPIFGGNVSLVYHFEGLQISAMKLQVIFAARACQHFDLDWRANPIGCV
jgi:hypothetical protein